MRVHIGPIMFAEFDPTCGSLLVKGAGIAVNELDADSVSNGQDPTTVATAIEHTSCLLPSGSTTSARSNPGALRRPAADVVIRSGSSGSAPEDEARTC